MHVSKMLKCKQSYMAHSFLSTFWQPHVNLCIYNSNLRVNSMLLMYLPLCLYLMGEVSNHPVYMMESCQIVIWHSFAKTL